MAVMGSLNRAVAEVPTRPSGHARQSALGRHLRRRTLLTSPGVMLTSACGAIRVARQDNSRVREHRGQHHARKALPSGKSEAW